MGKKFLYVVTIGETMYFFEKLVERMVKDGHTVHIACNNSADDVPSIYKELGCKIYNIDCSRSPLNKGNLKAIKQIRNIVSSGDYDIVHCHTPIAAMCTRLACKNLRKKGVKVYYTAHGFHFYDGAPVKNWIMFYPVEKICSKYTDVLITINKQDYNRANKKMKAKSIVYVPGVGVDTEHFKNVACDRTDKRLQINVPEDAYLILSVGELNDNKNHGSVIKALAMMNETKDHNIHYAIAGTGDNEEYLNKLASNLGIGDRVHILGYRNDVAELFKCSDLFIHPSFREGLPVSVMEAMASGILVTGANIRGCQDLINEKYLFEPDDISGISKCISQTIKSDNGVIKEENYNKVRSFDIDSIIEKMYSIYEIE